jgi:hypothetical protein
MTTTSTSTTTTPSSSASVKSKRPKVLILAAVLMLLAAALSFATPFVPRGSGLGGSGGPGGAPPANGQAPAGGQPAAGQNFTPGQDGAPGQNGGPGLNSGRTGGALGVMSFMQPVRIGEAAVGGLLALFAALGLWRLKKWGRNLTVLVAGASVLSAAATFLSPLLGTLGSMGRTPWQMLFTSSTWQAIAGLSLGLVAAILALLPAARQAYVVKPKERRVM